jgi:hypothetical protein
MSLVFAGSYYYFLVFIYLIYTTTKLVHGVGGKQIVFSVRNRESIVPVRQSSFYSDHGIELL